MPIHIIDNFKTLLRQFVQIPEQDFQLLESDTKIQSFKKKELIVSDNLNRQNLIFVHDGLVRAYENHDGRECTTSFFLANSFFLDFEFVYSGERRLPIYVDAIEDSTLILIPYEKMLEAYSKSHAFESLGRLMVERSFMDYIKQSGYMQGNPSPQERYVKMIEEEAELINRVPLKVLASYLRITPESLSRIRKTLSES